MKIASWIFTALSFLAIPVMFAIWAILKTDDTWLDILIIGVVLFLVLGYIGHIIAAKYRRVNGGGCTVPYIATFPAFAVPFVIFGAIFLILSFINWICYVFTDRYLISEFLVWLRKTLLGIDDRKASKNGGVKNENVFMVIDGGTERYLTMIEEYAEDHAVHGKVYHEIVGSARYNRFVDDIGNYWRSYDNNKTFVSEHELEYQGYSFS